jgi:hypothetical protein
VAVVLEFIVVRALPMVAVVVQVVVVQVEEQTVRETLTATMVATEQTVLVVVAVDKRGLTHQVQVVRGLYLFATPTLFQTWFQLAQVLPKKVAD